MKNYSTKGLENKTLNELVKIASAEYKKHQGLIIKNISNGVSVLIKKDGRNETARRYINREKIAIIKDLPFVLRNAVFNNFGKIKPHQKKRFPNSILFINYKYNCLVDGKKKSSRVSVILDNKGIFHYSLEFSEKRTKK